jgi:hypothetical protein
MYAIIRRNSVICLTAAILIWLAASLAQAAEKWTIQFSGTYQTLIQSPNGAIVGVTKFTGTGQISADKWGRFTGVGNIKLDDNLTGPLMKCQGAGTGGFQITGRRQGKYLSVSFEKAAVPVRGTCTISIGGTAPYETSFDPSVLTVPSRVIERKNGATISDDIAATGQSAAGGGRVTGKVNLSLSGGSDIDSDKPKGEFPNPPKIWTLSNDWDYTMACQGAYVTGNGTGSAQFPLPKGDGTVKGEGTTTASHRGTTPISSGAEGGKGRLLIEGEIKDDLLAFLPGFVDDSGQMSGSGAGGSQAASFGGMAMWGRDVPIVIPVKDGARVVDKRTYDIALCHIEVNETWSLHGEDYPSNAGPAGPMEAWRIAFDAWDKWTNEVQTGVKAGANAHWRVDVTVLLANHQWKSATAVATALQLNGISDPPGVFNVLYGFDAFATIPVTGSVQGNNLTLTFPRDDSGKLGIDYKVELMEDDLEKTLQDGGVPDASTAASDLKAKGTIHSTEKLLIPRKGTYTLTLAEGTQPGVGDEKIALKKLY